MINKAKKSTFQPLDIYSAKLTFRMKKDGSKDVKVQIRYSRKGRSRKERVPLPEDINYLELCWGKYRGEPISVYHRTGDNYKYDDMESKPVPTHLGQRLENLVREVYFKNSTKSKLIK